MERLTIITKKKNIKKRFYDAEKNLTKLKKLMN